MKKMKKVGIIGCGAIGTLIAQACDNRTAECDKLILFDYNSEKSKKLKESLQIQAETVKTVEEMIETRPSVIVEAASQQAVKEYVQQVLTRNIDFVIMSVGALLDLNIKSSKIHVPSGAIGGLDAISSAALAGIETVVLTTRKNPKVLNAKGKRETIIYEGTAEEAVRLFPKEMNVAATLALTVRPARVKVQVVADPKTERNTHQIRVKWKYGEMFLEFSNDPHPENPGTSALAAWSAVKLLKEILARSR